MALRKQSRMPDQYCASVIPGKVPVKKLLETEVILAYYARQPQWPVHIILVPKQHVASIIDFVDMPHEALSDIMKAVARVAKMIIDIHGKCRVMTNAGQYQNTQHLHWHIFVEK